MLLSDLGKACSEKGSSALLRVDDQERIINLHIHTFVESGFMRHAPHLEACHKDMGTADVHPDTG